MSRKDDRVWQNQRRKLEQFFNATTIRFRTAVSADNADLADRAATDLLQVIDEMLVHVGLPALTGPEDCPDCGQVLDDITEDEQNYLDSRGEL